MIFLKPPDQCRVDGQWVQMLPSVAQEVGEALLEARSGGPHGVLTVSYVSEGPKALVRVHRFGRGGREVSATAVPVTDPRLSFSDVASIVAGALERASEAVPVPSSPAPEASSGGSVLAEAPRDVKLKAGPPVADPVARRCLDAWARLAGVTGGSGIPRCLLVEDNRGRVVPGRYLIDRGNGDPIPIVQLPEGAWVPANTAFSDPARRYPVILSHGGEPAPAGVDHPIWLLRYLKHDVVHLYAAVSSEVAAWLRQADVEAMGLPDPVRPVWQRGRYLFLSPWKGIGTYFYNKSVTLQFVVPWPRLESAVVSRLLSANLFLADRGEVLDPEARFGATDIGLELVAVGSDGIAWLLDYLKP